MLRLLLPHPPGLPELKLITASGVAVLAAGVDAAADMPIASWESLTLKGALLAAIIYLVRENATQRATHKAESDARQAALKEETQAREKEMLEAIRANTQAKEAMAAAMVDLRNATKEQTDYYKAVAKVIITREVKPHLPEEPDGH